MVEKEGENEAIVMNLIICDREISRTYPLAWDRVSAVVRIVESLVEGQRHDTRSQARGYVRDISLLHIIKFLTIASFSPSFSTTLSHLIQVSLS